MVLYTDGVPEAINSRQEMFNVERAAQALSQAGPHADMTALVDNLERAITAFSGNAPQSDDITVLALHHREDSAEAPAI
jgi:sigma-B regulation protein RsbU (phosphoserine phosphatase)